MTFVLSKHLSSLQFARHLTPSIKNMNNKINLFKPLADQGPLNVVDAAQLGSFVKQTRPGPWTSDRGHAILSPKDSFNTLRTGVRYIQTSILA